MLYYRYKIVCLIAVYYTYHKVLKKSVKIQRILQIILLNKLNIYNFNFLGRYLCNIYFIHMDCIVYGSLKNY